MEPLDENDVSSSKSWLGSSLVEICRGSGSWSFYVSPIDTSKYHSVLYELPASLKEPPNPHYYGQVHQWDDDHVRMPYSEKNLFPVKENGTDIIKQRWNIVNESLRKPIGNSKALELAIRSYNNNIPTFTALHSFFEEAMEPEESEIFFKTLLPKMVELALKLPDLVPCQIPLLKKNHNRSLSISQLQIACLLANAFFCTFPSRKDTNAQYPGVNFIRLFAASSRPARQNSIWEKFKCIFHYFRRITTVAPVGVVTFERKFIHRSNLPRWDDLDHKLGNTKIHIDSCGTIEEGHGFLQVDFANKNVGGGVLGHGCVQEEIRFIICPELIIARLFVEQLGDHEAVIVTGPERYSGYLGYADTFQWNGNYLDQTPFDEYGRRRTSICIIDATRFNKASSQFYPSAMLRELNKAYVGFSSNEKKKLAPIATGNWGCGAFKGNSKLKALLQLMACSVASRDLVYYSFGDEDLKKDFHEIFTFLATHNVIITELWRFLCRFSTANISEDHLYSFIQQAYFDAKYQPSIKSFLIKSSTKKESPKQNKGKTPRNIKISTQDQMESSEDIMGDIHLYDDDVIPSSPPQVTTWNIKDTKGKSKKISTEDIVEKLPKTDIVELIDIIDGSNTDKRDHCRGETLLSHLDSYPKKLKKDVIYNVQSSSNNGATDHMDVDTPQEIKNKNSCIEESRGITKRKISDYFQIKNKLS